MAKRGRRKKSSRKVAKRGAANGARRGRPSALAGASMSDIKAEIGRRVGDLERRRDELSDELTQIESDIAELRSAFSAGGAQAALPPARRGRPPASPPAAPAARRSGGTARGAARGRRRARNQQSLAESLKTLLTGNTMSVTDMADAVQKAGYKTKSAGNFRTIVNQTLIRDPKTFKRVGRGQYTAKA
jgi:hypothetical protein